MVKSYAVYLPLIVVFLLTSPVFSKEDASIDLLNDLNLRPDQMEFILQKAKEACEIRRCATDKANLCKAGMADASSLIKKEVERLSRQAYVDIDKIAASIAEDLEESQISTLDSYKPRVIPITQDGRTGQAGTHQGVIRILEKVRSIPGDKFRSVRGEFADTIIEKTKLKSAANVKFDVEQAKLVIFRVFDKARAMEAVDFGSQKEALAAELQDAILPHTPSMERADKIKKFLLSENIIPILEGKLERK